MRRRSAWSGPLALACLAVGGLAGCGGPPVGSSAARSGGTDHLLIGPTGHFASATLEVTSGTTAVDVAAQPLSGELYRVDTPSNSGIRPLATVHGDTASLYSFCRVRNHRQAPGGILLRLRSFPASVTASHRSCLSCTSRPVGATTHSKLYHGLILFVGLPAEPP